MKNKILKDVKENLDFYFCHSIVVNQTDYVVSETTFKNTFPSIINKDNIYGIQFHPEKSHIYGLENFKKFFLYVMLKKRIIPSLLIKDNKLVKGKKFNNYVNVGNPVLAIKVYSHQYADELIFIRIDNSDPISDLINALKLASENCFAPLTAGGGIKEQNEINLLCKNGADKVLLNSILTTIKILKDASKNFGRSTLVAGIDIIEENSKFFHYISTNKNINRETNLIDWLNFEIRCI